MQGYFVLKNSNVLKRAKKQTPPRTSNMDSTAMFRMRMMAKEMYRIFFL